MADSDKVLYDDLFDEDAVSRLADEFEKVIPVVTQSVQTLAKNIHDALDSGGNLGTLEDLKKINEQIKQSDTVSKQFAETKKLEAEARKLNAEAQKTELQANKLLLDQNKKAEDQARKNILAYSQLTAELKKNRDISKDLQAQVVLGNKLTAEQTALLKSSTSETQRLDTAVKKIDYSVGQAQRNVGNYNGQLETLGKSVKGFGALGNILARAVGIDPQISEGIYETGKALEDLKRAHDGVTLATEGQQAAEESEAVASGISTGGILLITGALIAAGAEIYNYINKVKEQKAAEEALFKTQDERYQENIKARTLIEDNDRANFKLKQDERVLNKQISQEQADSNVNEYDAQVEIIKLRIKNYSELSQLAEKLHVQILDTGEQVPGRFQSDAYNEEFKKRQENLEKQATAIREKYANKTKENAIKINKDRKKINLDDLDEANKEGQKRAKQIIEEDIALAKSYIKRREESFDAHDKKILSNMQEEAKKRLKVNDLYQAKLDNIEKEAERKKKERKQLEDEITKGIQDGLKERSNLQQQYDQKEIDSHKRAIDIQAKLAAGGKDNTLAQQEALAAKAEEKKLQDAKRQQRLQENITLIKTFSDTLQKSLDEGDNFGKAFSKAAASEGLVAAMFSKLISGSAYEGTEDTGSGQGLDNKNGMLYMVHPNERIINKEQNKLLAGITNDELVRNAMFANTFMPLFDAANITTTHKSKYDNPGIDILRNELIELRKTIENKPTQSIRLDKLGNWTEEIEDRGIRTIKHYYKQNTRPSLKRNG